MLKQQSLTESEKEYLKPITPISISLTTLTPVCISAGKDSILSHITDVVIKDGIARYINHHAIENALSGKTEVLDRFVRAIHNSIDNGQADFSLENFIAKEKLGKFSNFISHEVKAYDLDENRKQIIPIIKNAGMPYISGSSIKGAIKTALLYDWLTNTQDGKVFLQTQVINKIKSNSLVINDLKKEILSKMKEFNTFLCLVSDTNYLSIDDIDIHNTVRLHIKNAKRITPQPRETIKTNSTFQFTMKLRKSVDSILKALHNFSIENILYEQDMLEKFDYRLKDLDSTEDSKLVISYKNRLNSLYNLKNVSLLRIGSGKSYYMNSIGLAIFNAEKAKEGENESAVFAKFRKLCKLGKQGQKLFPITRAMTTKNYLPLGWVALQIGEKEIPQIIKLENAETHEKTPENATTDVIANLLAQKFAVNKGNNKKR